jgi:hypothetical protein
MAYARKRTVAELKNEFSWSKSRDDVFSTCPRKYYFAYYGSWKGWEATAPERTRQLYVLKQLKTRAMWAGERVHRCIEHTLKNLQRGIDVLAPQQIIEITLSEMRTDFKSSRAKNYWKNPKTCALFEHEYAIPVPDEKWRKTAADAEACLRNFYTSDLFAGFRALPRDAWVEIEELGHFALEGLKIWARIDCAHREEEKVRIIDWKTGRIFPGGSAIQLVCYCLYGHTKWGVPVDSIRPSEYYLLANSRQDYSISTRDVEDAKNYIRGSVEDMRSLLADPEKNEPLAESALVKTDDRRACLRCNYVGRCRPELLPELQKAQAPEVSPEEEDKE